MYGEGNIINDIFIDLFFLLIFFFTLFFFVFFFFCACFPKKKIKISN